MPVLSPTTVVVAMSPAKSAGQNDLGIPPGDTLSLKRGKLAEFTQPRDDGQPGRRFQNLRCLAIRTQEGGVPSHKLVVQVEAFGDDNVPLGGAPGASGYQLALKSGDVTLATLDAPALFLPYACTWYDNRSAHDLTADIFDRLDAVALTVPAEDIRLL